MNNDTITINGFDLSEVIRIIEIIRPVGNERSIETNDAPLLGVNLQEVRTGAKFIKVKFAMQERDGMTLEQAKHILAGVFNTSEAVRIVISDEPDKYYMGLVTGSVDMDNVTRWFQKGEFELLIPDGVAHSTTYRLFESGVDNGGEARNYLSDTSNAKTFSINSPTNYSVQQTYNLISNSTLSSLGFVAGDTITVSFDISFSVTQLENFRVEGYSATGYLFKIGDVSNKASSFSGTFTLSETNLIMNRVAIRFDNMVGNVTVSNMRLNKSRYKQPYIKAAEDNPDAIVMTLINDGNVPAFPVVTVKNNAENGYIGLVNTSGALEVGDREEADTVQAKQSELLFDYRDSKITNGLSAATKNVAILNDTLQSLRGTVASVDWSGRKHLFLQNAGGTTGNNAGSLTWNIPADSSGATGSLNDYIWWRQVFWLGAANQYGFIKLTVSDEQGRFLYGVETFKRYNGLGCEYNFMAADGKGGYNMIKQWTFTGTHLDSQNPFNEPRGWSDLKRNDDKVTVFWWGSYNTFVIPEIKGRKSAKVHVAFGALGNKPLVARMYLDSIFYRKDFVAVTKDIPNRYPIGSNVVLNSENDTVTVDGLERIVDIVHGSTFLTIPPGRSTLEVYSSSWVRTKPTVKIEFEERYL